MQSALDNEEDDNGQWRSTDSDYTNKYPREHILSDYQESSGDS